MLMAVQLFCIAKAADESWERPPRGGGGGGGGGRPGGGGGGGGGGAHGTRP